MPLCPARHNQTSCKSGLGHTKLQCIIKLQTAPEVDAAPFSMSDFLKFSRRSKPPSETTHGQVLLQPVYKMASIYMYHLMQPPHNWESSSNHRGCLAIAHDRSRTFHSEDLRPQNTCHTPYQGVRASSQAQGQGYELCCLAHELPKELDLELLLLL